MLLLAVLLAAARATPGDYSSRISTGLRVLYDFTEKGAITFTSDRGGAGKPLGDLRTNVGFTVALPIDRSALVTTGGTQAQSTFKAYSFGNNSAPLFPSNSDWTIELWFRDTSTPQIAAFFGFGGLPLSATTFSPSATSFFIVSRRNSFIYCDFWGSPPISVNFPHPGTALTHLVFTYKFDSGIGTRVVTTYINGVPYGFDIFDSALWASASHRLRFGDLYAWESQPLGPSAGASNWTGEFYLAAIYASALDDAQVLTNYEASIQNSPPVPGVVSLSAPEDTLTSFNLTSYDYDNALAVEVAMPAWADALSFRINSRPTRGSIYVLDSNSTGGQPRLLLASDIPYSVVSSGNQIWYAGGLDYFGADSLLFQAFDGISWGPNGTLSITVTPVNDPPVPTSNTQAVSYSDNFAVIQLNSTDVDDPANTGTVAYIVSLPTNGDLYNIISVGVYQLIDFAALASAQPNGVVVTDPNRRLRFDTRPLSVPDGISVVLTDSFQFKVADSHGAMSLTNGTLSINILNDLQAFPSSLTTDEDVQLTINTIGGHALGDPFQFQVTSLPTSGTLRLADNTPISSGSLPLNYNGTLKYLPNQDLYGSPFDSFTFRTKTAQLASASATVTISVLPINDPPVITYSPAEPVAQPLSPALIRINITDVDVTDQNRTITVQLVLDTAAVTLNNPGGAYEGLDFAVGDGTSDRTMTFSAPMAVANELLSTVTYQPVETTVDHIHIRVDDNDPTSPTRVFGDIAVKATAEKKAKAKGSPVPAIASAIGIVAVLGTGLCCFFIYQKKKRADLAKITNGGNVELAPMYDGPKRLPRAYAAYASKLAPLERLLLEEDLATVYGLARVVSQEKYDATHTAKALIQLFGAYNQENELLHSCITSDVQHAPSAEAMLGIKTTSSRMMAYYGKSVAVAWLYEMFAPLIDDIILNIDRVDDSLIANTCQRFFDVMKEKIPKCPLQIHEITFHLKQKVEARFPGYGNLAVGRFVVNDLICPAIGYPKAFQLCKSEPGKKAHDHLKEVASTFSRLVTGEEYGPDTGLKQTRNFFIKESSTLLNEFLNQIATVPPGYTRLPFREPPQSKALAIGTLHNEIVCHISPMESTMAQQDYARLQAVLADLPKPMPVPERDD